MKEKELVYVLLRNDRDAVRRGEESEEEEKLRLVRVLCIHCTALHCMHFTVTIHCTVT